jgi:flagellar hook-associated protein 3 FlgL
MIQGVDPEAAKFLADVNQLQNRLNTDQAQISSGLRVNQPSDDPSVVSDILQLSSSLSRNTQIGQNLNNVSAEVSGAETALSTAITTLDNVATLGAQADSSTQTAASRAQLAAQVQDALQNLIGDANTTVNNRYLFSGDSDQTVPYTLDLTTATGASAYAGSAATRQVEDPRGGTFAISQTAQQIFDAPGTSVFAAVNSLRVALLNNDQAGIETALGDLKTAQTSINSSLAFYGTVQNDVASATAASKTIALQLQTNMSDIRDADVVAATSDLSEAELNLQAAFQARGKFPSTSLFNFLA